MLVVTVGLGLSALLYPGYRANRHLVATNRKIEGLTPQVRAIENVQRELERKRKLLASIESLETSALRPLPMLRELTDLVPAPAPGELGAAGARGVLVTGDQGTRQGTVPHQGRVGARQQPTEHPRGGDARQCAAARARPASTGAGRG
jgi:hypothetical protein